MRIWSISTRPMLPIRFAILGCGKFAGYHARTLSDRDDCDVVACVDVNKSVVADFVAQHLAGTKASDAKSPIVQATDIAATLASVKPDAVVITTPHTLHFEHVNAALDARCHVFVEKPMVTQADHARAIEAKLNAMKPQPVFVVGYNTVCTPEFDYLRRVIASPHSDIGLGELKNINAWLSQNWLAWCRGSWRLKPELSGGGFAYDTGAHLLASLCYSVNQPIAEVTAHIDRCDEAVDINSSVHVRFANDVTADLTLNGNCASEGCRMTFLFEGGRIEIDGWYGSWIEVHNAWGKVKYPKVNTDQVSHSALENFIHAVQGKDTPKSGAAMGVIQADLMDGLYLSAQKGTSITF